MLFRLQIRPISITSTLNSCANSKASAHASFFLPSISCARSRTALIKSSSLPIFALPKALCGYAKLDISQTKKLRTKSVKSDTKNHRIGFGAPDSIVFNFSLYVLRLPVIVPESTAEVHSPCKNFSSTPRITKLLQNMPKQHINKLLWPKM